MDGPGCAGSRTSRGAISAGSPGKAGIMKRLAREARQMAVHRLCALRNPGLRTHSTRSGCFAIMLATLSGCGLAEVERARMETGDVARQVSALRGSGASAPGAPQAGPRLSTVRLIERRPYVGLTPIEPDPRAACAEALARGARSADVVLNILARQCQPAPPATIPTPEGLRFRHRPVADCQRHDRLREAGHGAS